MIYLQRWFLHVVNAKICRKKPWSNNLLVMMTFDGFSDKYETLHYDLKITQNCDFLLLDRLDQLERNAVSILQYCRRETLVIIYFTDNILEETVYHALSLTGINVSPDQLHSCHWLNKKDQVIVEFNCRKHRQNVLYNPKNLQSQVLDLIQLHFLVKLFVD